MNPTDDPESTGSDVQGISVWTASALVIAAMVGTGVYVSLGYQVAGLPSGFPILLIWFIGGLWAFCGGICYAELAAIFPRSGGEYNLLGQAVHPLAGYLAGWISLVAGFVAPIALAASVMGTYLDSICGFSVGKYIAAAVLVFLALLQTGPLSLNSLFLNVFTWLKLMLVSVIILAAFGFADSTGISFLPQPGDGKLVTSSAFGISMIYVSYAYTGWNTSTYIVGEVRDPQKNVPRSLLLGTVVVTLLYIGLNAAFLYATPLDAIRSLEVKENVGPLAAEYIFGSIGGKVVAGVIAFGLLSFIASMLWASSRIMQTMGQDHAFLSLFARKNRFAVPSLAIATSTIAALALLMLDRFDAVLTYTQFVLVLSNSATVAAMVWLRFARPEIERPFRAWGFPIVPLFFLGFNLVFMTLTVSERPLPALWGMATVLLPIPLYFLGGGARSEGR